MVRQRTCTKPLCVSANARFHPTMKKSRQVALNYLTPIPSSTQSPLFVTALCPCYCSFDPALKLLPTMPASRTASFSSSCCSSRWTRARRSLRSVFLEARILLISSSSKRARSNSTLYSTHFETEKDMGRGIKERTGEKDEIEGGKAA